jgi:TolB-like protein/DNA-binding winged helix-turn-helix (wHTH) protein/cytochrome c-type biogenesis protein CcmH/NrfG
MRFLFGDCALDPTRRELWRGSEAIHVEPQVFDLLLHLIRNRDRVISKDDILAAVWGGRIVSESTMSNRINSARRAIGDSGEQQQFIRTVPRRGLRFVGYVREESNQSPPAHSASALLTEPLVTLQSAHAAGGSERDAIGAYEYRGKPTVAVLPFDNMSGDPEQDYFSDGISEDIITLLSKHRALFVVARNSAFAFKGRGSDVRHIGENLGANYIVEGGVRKVGQHLRITAHLIETEGGRLLWAEQYDRSLEEVLEVQDQITTTIAARIEPRIGTAERFRTERLPPKALQAWDLFHLGTKHFYRSTNEDNLQAQQLFRRALELDPNLAQAHGFLSYAIVLKMLYFDADPEKERLDEALAIAKKGVELDEQDALIRFAYGRALLARRAYGDALAELETALELNPALPVVYCGLADSLAYDGRFAEAMPYFEKAINLSPHDPQRWAFYSYGALAHLFAQEFEEAQKWAYKAIRIPNCHYWPFAHRVAALGHLQRVEDIQPALAELLQRKPGFTCSFARGRLFYVRSPTQLDLYVEGLRRAGLPE